MSATASGRVKTKSDLVVMLSGGQISAFFCSERDHKPQNSGCSHTAQRFHTTWYHSSQASRRDFNRSRLEDFTIPRSNRLEKLKGNLKDFYSIRVNDQWRVIFKWINGEPHEVRIVDYH
jgi:plasmid maintenance system killer protein